MGELLSVGLDVGTTTTQLIVSELTVENRASGFAVPQMDITARNVRYRSPVFFTPLKEHSLVDGPALEQLVERCYREAGIRREDVDTGAVIVTGEASRKENARTVLEALARYAGDFVVTTAGPHLESVLAAKGAGAVAHSRENGCRVLHMDIGGGTTNLALIDSGHVTDTGCLNVGGRLLKTDEAGQILYLSPAVRDLTDLRAGDIPRPEAVAELTGLLTQALEMAAGLRPVSPLLETLWTKEAGAVWPIPEDVDMISFSGGVAECVRTPLRPEKFGDIGPALGQAIRQSRLCQGAFMLGAETLRATVIGAGCHSTQLSGSTIFRHKLSLPLHDLPVVTFSREAQEDPALPDQIRRQLSAREGTAVLAFPGVSGYDAVASLAKSIAAAAPDPCLVCLEADMAKALGQRLALLRPDTPCLCIDRVQLSPESYLDIGSSTGPALPVVVKTLVFGP